MLRTGRSRGQARLLSGVVASLLLGPLASGCGEVACEAELCVLGEASVSTRISAKDLVRVTSESGEELLVGIRAESRQVSVIREQGAETRAIEGRATAIAAGDLDGDGVREIAIATRDPRSIELFTLSGDRSLRPKATLEVDEIVRAMRAADLDGDGRAELVTSVGEGGIVVFRGDGSSEAVASQGAPNLLEVGDLDGDGVLDLVAIDFLSGDLLVHPGDGAGSFGAPRTRDVGAAITALALGDIDGDGDLDVAVAGVGVRAKLLLNDGSASFSEGVEVPAKVFEAYDDLWDERLADGGLSIQAPGDLGFGSLAWIEGPSYARELVSVLVNSDGDAVGERLRLLLRANAGPLVALGEGDFLSAADTVFHHLRPRVGPTLVERRRLKFTGSVEASRRFALLSPTGDEAAVPIVLFRDERSGLVLVPEGDGFAVSGEAIAHVDVDGLLVADVDGDGDEEVLALDARAQLIELGHPDGSGGVLFDTTISLPAKIVRLTRFPPTEPLSGPDGLLGQSESGELWRLTIGAGGSIEGEVLPLSSDVSGGAVRVADVDLDGDEDIVVLGDHPMWAGIFRSVQVLLAEGPEFVEGPAIPIFASLDADWIAQDLFVDDSDRNGIPEILVVLSRDRSVEVHHLESAWEEAALRQWSDTYPVSMRQSVTAEAFFADLDGDGVRDLFVAENFFGEYWALSGVTGGFETRPVSGAHPLEIVGASDLDGDGRAELLALGKSEVSEVSVELHSAFRSVREWPRAAAEQAIATADLDGDGADEVILGYEGNIIVVSNALDAASKTVETLAEDVFFAPPFRGTMRSVDLEDDGREEVLLESWTRGKELVRRREGGIELVPAMFTEEVPPGLFPRELGLHDLDGDGVVDLAFAEDGALIVAYGELLGESLHFGEQSRIARRAREGLTISDLNGDGRAELIIGSGTPAEGSASTFTVALADPGRSWRRVEFEAEAALADPEGGGVLLRRGDSLVRRRLVGERFMPEVSVVQDPILEGAWLLSADLDGDGRRDLVSSGGDGIGLWLRRSSAFSLEARNEHSWRHPVVGDLDGDGRDEVITGWTSEGLWILRVELGG